MIQRVRTSMFKGKKATFAATGFRKPSERNADLEFLKRLIEAGTIKPVIDRTYPLEQISDAHTYVDTGHKKRNVVIMLDHLQHRESQ